MLPTPCYVFGDSHLGVASPDAERELIRFLRHLPGRARSLVIMGDVFDFWFAWRHVMPRSGFRTLAAIADTRDAGIEVLWIGGNHDCWGGDTLARETGARYTLEPWRGLIGGWPALLEHGDGLRGEADAPYRRLRRVVRHPWSIRAFGLLHPDFASRIALASSHTSRHRRADDEGRALFEVGARELEKPDGAQLVIHGHSHVPTLAPAGRGWYANAGAWYLDRQFLRIDEARVELRQWSGSGEGDLLDAGDRRIEEALREAEKALRRV